MPDAGHASRVWRHVTPLVSAEELESQTDRLPPFGGDQPVGKLQRGKGLFQIRRRFLEVLPAFGVHGHDLRLGKGVRGRDGIVAVHRQVESPSRLCRTGKGNDNAWAEPARDVGDPFVPDRIAADIDGVAFAREADGEAGYVASDRLDPDRAMAG